MNKKIIEELMNTFPKKTEFKPREVIATAIKIGLTEKDAYKGLQEFPKIRRGVYDLSMVMGSTEKVSAPVTAIKNVGVRSVTNDEVFVPQFDETFVAWGHFNDIVKIIKTKMFYPTYISGLSGNGKTFMVEQACAKANREYVRVQISPETDEDDLIGGFRLIDGETVFQKGPVIKAMEAGAILMIDEIDRGTNKIMCLQGVLEGKPVLIKKTGEVIAPAEGFNVLATANTKGKGSDLSLIHI